MKKKDFLKKFFLGSIALAGILSVNTHAGKTPGAIKQEKKAKKVSREQYLENNLEMEEEEKNIQNNRVQNQNIPNFKRNNPQQQLAEGAKIKKYYQPKYLTKSNLFKNSHLTLNRFFYDENRSIQQRNDQLKQDFEKVVNFYFDRLGKNTEYSKTESQYEKNMIYNDFSQYLTRIFQRFLNNGEIYRHGTKRHPIKDMNLQEIKNILLDKNQEENSFARDIFFIAEFLKDYLSPFLGQFNPYSANEKSLIRDWTDFGLNYFFDLTKKNIWKYYAQHPQISSEYLEKQLLEIFGKYFGKESISRNEVINAGQFDPLVQKIWMTFSALKKLAGIDENNQNQMFDENNQNQMIFEEFEPYHDYQQIPQQSQINPLNQSIGENNQNQIMFEQFSHNPQQNQPYHDYQQISQQNQINPLNQSIGENNQNQIMFEQFSHNPQQNQPYDDYQQIPQQNQINPLHQSIGENNQALDYDYALDNTRSFNDFMMNQNNNQMFEGNNQMFDYNNQMFDEYYTFDDHNQNSFNDKSQN